MTQLSSSASTCEARWKMCHPRVFAVIYLTAVCTSHANTEFDLNTVQELDMRNMKYLIVVGLAVSRAVTETILEDSVTTPLPTTPYVPPVPVLELKSALKEVFTTEKVELRCFITGSSDWTFTWQMNGQQLSSSLSVFYPGDGSVLTIPSATAKHSGAYSCSGQHKVKGVDTKSSNSLQITVTEPPIPTLDRVTPWTDVFISETVEYSCKVSPDWTATWYKDSIGLSKEGPTLSISSAVEADQGVYTCKAQLKSREVFSGPSARFELKVYAKKPKPKLSRSSDFDKMYPGETITFTCSVDESSGWEYVWYHTGGEIQSSSSKTYRIPSIAHSNSGDYHCKARRMSKDLFYTDASDTIVLKVSDPPAPTLRLVTPWSDVFEDESLEFHCTVNSSDWTFTWSQDQNDLGNEKPSLRISPVTKANEGQYACKAQLKSRRVISGLSNTVSVTVYAKKPKPKLSRSSDFDKMYPGETITFTCSVDESSGWEYVWYHKGGEIQSSSSKTYRIPSIAHSNSGDYHCKARRMSKDLFYTDASDTIVLKVSDPPAPTLRLVTPWSDVFEDESLEFHCTVNSSDWTFTWSQDLNDLGNEKPSLRISPVTKANEGQYACKAQLKSRRVISGLSNTVSVTVYAKQPKPKLSRSSDFDKMYPGENITFTCSVDESSGWEYVWYHKGGEIQPSSSKTYRIPSIAHSNSGDYHCKAKRGSFYSDQSNTASVQVSDPPTPTLKLLSPWSDVFQSEDLAFSCEVSSPDWTFTWHRDQRRLQKDSRVKMNEKGSLLNITSVTRGDQGGYACKAQLESREVISGFSSTTDVLVYESIPTSKLSRYPVFDPMYVGETVNFTCSVDVSSGWEYQWYKGEKELYESGKAIRISLAVSHKGEYSCKASRGQKTSTRRSNKIRLDVQEIPVPSLKAVTQWLDVFPTEKVELSCEMKGSSGWTYMWYNNKSHIKADGTIHIKNDGGKLSINAASTSHRGNYSCSGRLKGRSVSSNPSTEVPLHVYDSKPRVMLEQNPEYSLMHTSDSVFFGCHVNVSSGWNYLWYKDDSGLDAASAKYHNISSVTGKNTGSYKCQVKRGDFNSDKSQAVKLTIEERPKAAITLLTGWTDVFSTDSLLLQCNVKDSQINWNYTWFKDKVPVNLQPSEDHQQHEVTPQNDPDQSWYTCKGIRDGRPSYSVISDSYRTKNLLLKRRILLAISGCLFFGIIAVFLGCIVLRLVRKPASVTEKPDESNLFLTMAQLKDCTDAPCPLVDYITDADLNAPNNEGEENGTICSETTPLPIGSQEDQAVTSSSSHDATENGSGMTSFLL